METGNDNLERHCPRLGGAVFFHYCKQCGDNGLPCWKAFDCWWEFFDIVTFLKENLSEDQFRRLVTWEPKPKLSSLIEMIEQAKIR